MACEDNTTVYLITLKDGKKKTITIECDWIIIGDKRYLIEKQEDLWKRNVIADLTANVDAKKEKNALAKVNVSVDAKKILRKNVVVRRIAKRYFKKISFFL